eukprot:COSAG03_NODE_274_length_9561_cov_13.502114_13_plen_222_part_00
MRELMIKSCRARRDRAHAPTAPRATQSANEALSPGPLLTTPSSSRPTAMASSAAAAAADHPVSPVLPRRTRQRRQSTVDGEEAELGALDLASDLPAARRARQAASEQEGPPSRRLPRLLCGHVLRFEAGPGQKWSRQTFGEGGGATHVSGLRRLSRTGEEEGGGGGDDDWRLWPPPQHRGCLSLLSLSSLSPLSLSRTSDASSPLLLLSLSRLSLCEHCRF